MPFLSRHDHFTIEDRTVRHQLAGSADDVAEAVGPVVAAAREHLRSAVLLVELRAVAVILDFVDPIPAARRFWREGREGGFDVTQKASVTHAGKIPRNFEGTRLKRVLAARSCSGTACHLRGSCSWQ